MSECCFLHHKSNMDWPGHEPELPQRDAGEKPLHPSHSLLNKPGWTEKCPWNFNKATLESQYFDHFWLQAGQMAGAVVSDTTSLACAVVVVTGEEHPAFIQAGGLRPLL
jgi:hypothetical protein